MAKITLKVTSNSITASVRRLEKNLNNLPNLAHAEFVKNTPKKTGNARNRTRVSKNTIQANYEYASELEAGRSRQAPRGMIAPTVKFIRAYLKKIMRK